MRDISISILDQNTGLAFFAASNIRPVSGIELLVAKVTKKILSSNLVTTLFTYYGLDLQQIPYRSLGSNSIDTLHSIISAGLQNIMSSIQKSTNKAALPTERLASLALTDLVYDNINNTVILQITLNPVVGSSQTLLFPLGA